MPSAVSGASGVLARLCWFWPGPVPFALGRDTPATRCATDALDRLRRLDLSPGVAPGDHPRPVMVPLAEASLRHMQAFGCEMQERQREAGGLMRSWLGKARGTALRLALVLEHLWWCARSGFEAPPAVISDDAFLGAATLVADYLLPPAERASGDAATAPADAWYWRRACEPTDAAVVRFSSAATRIGETWAYAASLTAHFPRAFVHASPGRGVVRCLIPEPDPMALATAFTKHRFEGATVAERLPGARWGPLARTAVAEKRTRRFKRANDPYGLVVPLIVWESPPQ